MMLDLVIKNGTVLDPGGGRSGRLDLGIQRGRVARLDPEIPAEQAARSIDASGLLVTPGLIDLHAHVYTGCTFWGVDPDPIAAETGVTTWVDAGSAGAFTLAGLHDYVAMAADVNVKAFVNISAIGLVAQDFELRNAELCSADLLTAVANRYRDFVVGVKFRAGRSGSAENLLPLERARQAADRLEMPLMVHISDAPPNLADVLEMMKPGDILTHAFTGLSMKIVDENGELLEAARKAWDSGIVIDIGHGAGSFSWETAEVLARKDMWPDTISTDIHQLSIHGQNRRGSPGGMERRSGFNKDTDAAGMVFAYEGSGERAFDLLDCMSKFLLLGLSEEEIVAATTISPARAIGLDAEIGSLVVGKRADIALLRIDEGNYELFDAQFESRSASKRFSCEMAIVGGEPMSRFASEPEVPWIVPVGP
jgi:dihydroorotase